jgi:hypothetical protein
MNANEFGKKLGIGVRVAGRIAQQRAEEAARAKAQQQFPGQNGPGVTEISPQAQAATRASAVDYSKKLRDAGASSQKFTRAAGGGLAGFFRPFRRVGGILWLEVTGFFFGLFALYFATDLWRTRLSYAAGPQHQRFLIALALAAVFGYLSVSAFWRARRR